MAKKSVKKATKKEEQQQEHFRQLHRSVERKHYAWLKKIDWTIGMALDQLHKIESDLSDYAGQTVGEMDEDGGCFGWTTEIYLDSQGTYDKDDSIDMFIESVQEDIAELEELAALHSSTNLLITEPPQKPAKKAASKAATNGKSTLKLADVKPDAMKYVKMGTLPRSVPAGKILVHNHIAHTPDQPAGRHGFRVWTQNPQPNLIKCDCGWANGIEHYKSKASK